LLGRDVLKARAERDNPGMPTRGRPDGFPFITPRRERTWTRMESFCVGRDSGPCDRAKRDCEFCVFFWDATQNPALGA
jgi:hypothetical protein